jgi:hypothetical protein
VNKLELAAAPKASTAGESLVQKRSLFAKPQQPERTPTPAPMAAIEAASSARLTEVEAKLKDLAEKLSALEEQIGSLPPSNDSALTQTAEARLSLRASLANLEQSLRQTTEGVDQKLKAYVKSTDLTSALAPKVAKTDIKDFVKKADVTKATNAIQNELKNYKEEVEKTYLTERVVNEMNNQLLKTYDEALESKGYMTETTFTKKLEGELGEQKKAFESKNYVTAEEIDRRVLTGVNAGLKLVETKGYATKTDRANLVKTELEAYEKQMATKAAEDAKKTVDDAKKAADEVKQAATAAATAAIQEMQKADDSSTFATKAELAALAGHSQNMQVPALSKRVQEQATTIEAIIGGAAPKDWVIAIRDQVLKLQRTMKGAPLYTHVESM